MENKNVFNEQSNHIMIYKPFIAYDVASVPIFIKGDKRITMEEILLMKDESGYLFYDSRLGKKPEILNGDIPIKIVDSNSPKWKQKFKMIVRRISKKNLIKRLNGSL